MNRELLQRHRAFLVACGTLVLLLAVLATLYSLFGHRLITDAWNGESLGLLERFYEAPGRRGLDSHLERADETFRAALACSLGVLALAALVYGLVRGRVRPALAVPALLLFWLLADHWIAPHLVRPLRLIQYRAVLDPDHRPVVDRPVPGWNSDGLRGSPEPEAFRAEDLNLIFLGDSFTYGMRIADPAQTFPALVQEQLDARFPGTRVRVANFGWTSSSPLLSLRRLADIGDGYQPDLVALFLDMTDVHDDVKWKNMLARRGVYRFQVGLPTTLVLLEKAWPGLYWSWWSATNDGLPRERYFLTEAPLEETREHFVTVDASLDAIDAWCRERDVPFLLFVLPRCWQYSAAESPNDYERTRPGRAHTVLGPHTLEPFRHFAERAGRVGYPVHSLLEPFRDSDVHPHCFDDDPHWNPAGHGIAAEAIAEILAPELEPLGAR